MFQSLAENFKKNCIGVVLTGLGNDGSKGIRYIKENGGIVIAQDESTSAVFGMPKAAAETGLVDYILSARMAPAKIRKILNGEK